ncbi:hypothetical protein [Desulfohalovibrio reitneri]|uniref:hypothetical protein n=1 Tax=Desulfohalovibrio reitneri TaxID=1307759 RepID=UPI00110E2CBA|nr:hypothetical protein [Desulfohalovibrio reitneri]
MAEPGGPEERLATAKALLACLEDALDGDPAALRELRRRADAVELALVRAAPWPSGPRPSRTRTRPWASPNASTSPCSATRPRPSCCWTPT